MGTIVDEILAEGEARGRAAGFAVGCAEGETRGEARNMLRNLKAIIKNCHYTPEEAMNSLEISQADRAKLLAQL
jgi:predicted GNAT family acetyltransferase